MRLNRTPNPLDRAARNSENDNWDIIEGEVRTIGDKVDDFVEEISDEAFNKIVDSARLDWDKMVDTFEDLPVSAAKGTTIGVKADGKVYRYDGSNWIDIYEINLNPISEVDDRLTSQLADIVNVQNWELNSKGRKKQSHVVFISDDFNKGDWEILKPIFQSANVPFCLAVVTDWMEPGHPNYETRGTWEQLEYLQNELGCEIMSHSKTHNRPKSLIEMTESELRYELSESRNELIRRGFDVQSFRVPGNQSNTKVRKIAKEFYRSMVVSNHEYMNIPPYETYDLKSIWIDNESYGGAKPFNYYKEHIDKAEENGELLIISMHGYALDGVEQLIADVVDYAKSKSRVTTLREALNRSGNVIEVGDYTKTTRSDRLGGSHFVVGSDGTMSGTTTFAKINQYDTNTKWWEFPLGKSVCAINNDHPSLNEFPEGRIGTLITVRPAAQGSYTYQEYRIFRTNVTYYRVLGVDEEFEDWTLGSQRIHFNHERQSNWNFTTGIKNYRQGITFNEVKSGNIDFDQAPGGRAGVRITYKNVDDNNSQSFNYQVYIHTSSAEKGVYIRNATGPDTWSEWTDLTSYSRVDNESYDLNSGISDFPLGQTMTYIEPNDPTINKAPETSPGTLITCRVRESGSWAFNYQEYHLNFKADRLSVYKRRAESATSWGDWILVSKE